MNVIMAFLQIDIYVASDMFCDSFEVKYPMSAIKKAFDIVQNRWIWHVLLHRLVENKYRKCYALPEFTTLKSHSYMKLPMQTSKLLG